MVHPANRTDRVLACRLHKDLQRMVTNTFRRYSIMTRLSKVLLSMMLIFAFQFTFGSADLPAANQVRIECPVVSPTAIEGDSVAIKVHITNDVNLSAFTLGFSYNSDMVEITRATAAPMITALQEWGGQFKRTFLPASNQVLIGYVDFSGADAPILPQTDGLAFTLYMKLLPGFTAHCVDLDSVYVPPAGPFIFAPVVGGKLTPNYVDCGTQDIKLGLTDCPSSNTAPVVADIPNQTILEGGTFATISLDDYVTDAESDDNLITWEATSASPNSFSVNIEAATRVATISFPGGEFYGSALFTFTATDPGALSASDTARFTVTGVNDPPVVAGIPNQILPYGSTFATISLDNYVTDPDDNPPLMTWSYSGNSELTVAISAERIATITKPSPSWSGSESIIFTATDPGLLFDSDTATFSIAAPAPIIEITPDTLTFSAYAGESNPVGQGAMITNTGNGTLDWNASEDIAWLSISSTSGSAPSGFTATVDITGIAPGSYLGDVTVTAAGASNSPQVLKVILNINNPVDIKLTPDSLSFYARKGGPNPPSKDVSITNAIPSGVEFDWGAIETSPWLSMSATTGKSPSTVSFSVDITDLSAGTYNTQVEIKQVSLTTGMGITDDIDTIYVKLLVDPPTGVEDDQGAVPKSYSLKQNYPNPFNPETVIEYNLAASGHITLTVFNVIGQKVVDVVNGYESAGNKQAVWNGRDESGREVQSGVYFYRLTTDNFSMTRKMMLLK
ncbi:MAG: T9SS type A sorting domain-containing protein [Candidatus Zixiibacteriota bacterium]|nr:MAG: T9SS type A sorting domain-containing protein [candidate division Zixibacteria bacterium]